jgi:tetratricopeptide (TPR) repeat protein
MDKDLPFELGRISAALDRPADALRFYLESLKRYREHPATLFNIGLCLYRLQRRAEALAYMERALGLNGTYAPAREWRVRIQGELAEA